MDKFVLAFHGHPAFETKQEGAAHMAAWMGWIKGLGDAVVDPGLPLGPSITINADKSVTGNGGANPVVGLTILQADSIKAATKMVQACPHLAAGGSIELAPAVHMDMS